MAITLAEDMARADLIVKHRRIKNAMALILGAFFMFAAGAMTEIRIAHHQIATVQ